MKNFNEENARAALQELTEALGVIQDALDTAVDDIDQQIEDGELDAPEREGAIWEVMDGMAEPISILKGQTLDLANALGE